MTFATTGFTHIVPVTLGAAFPGGACDALLSGETAPMAADLTTAAGDVLTNVFLVPGWNPIRATEVTTWTGTTQLFAGWYWTPPASTLLAGATRTEKKPAVSNEGF